ncbi:MAG: GNAT family N-acetyltransferase [Sphingomonadaceae bacterium]
MTGFRIVEDDLTGPDIAALLRAHLDAMHEHSPPGSVHALDLQALKAPEITFWSIWVEDRLAGCGALKELEPDHGEIKSMRTAQSHLRRGVASQVLSHMIAVARERGYRRLSLETGSSAPFVPAHRLYEAFGFEPCGPYGDYEDEEFSQYYRLWL